MNIGQLKAAIATIPDDVEGAVFARGVFVACMALDGVEAVFGAPDITTPPKQALGPNQRAWIVALRSGSYAQTTKTLHCTTGGFCCLGVAVNITGVVWEEIQGAVQFMNCEENPEAGVLDAKFVKLYALRSANGKAGEPGFDCLTELNDSGMTFEEIATVLETTPEQYFIEAR